MDDWASRDLWHNLIIIFDNPRYISYIWAKPLTFSSISFWISFVALCVILDDIKISQYFIVNVLLSLTVHCTILHWCVFIERVNDVPAFRTIYRSTVALRKMSCCVSCQWTLHPSWQRALVCYQHSLSQPLCTTEGLPQSWTHQCQLVLCLLRRSVAMDLVALIMSCLLLQMVRKLRFITE